MHLKDLLFLNTGQEIYVCSYVRKPAYNQDYWYMTSTVNTLFHTREHKITEHKRVHYDISCERRKSPKFSFGTWTIYQSTYDDIQVQYSGVSNWSVLNHKPLGIQLG